VVGHHLHGIDDFVAALIEVALPQAALHLAADRPEDPHVRLALDRAPQVLRRELRRMVRAKEGDAGWYREQKHADADDDQ
jgi:hypothetical protein